LLGKADLDSLRQAFQVKADIRDLRRDQREAIPVGVVAGVWGDTYPDKLPPLDTVKPPIVPARRELVFDPGVSQSGDGIYTSLAGALEDARPGDVIQLRFNGLKAVSPVQLQKSTVNLTIRPAPGFHPVLTIGETADKDVALFTVYDGQLTLEGLELLLRPSRAEFLAQSAVRLFGDGGCECKDCVFTLDRSTTGTDLAVTTLADPASVMKMDKTDPRPLGQTPRFHFKNCFVRGEGELLWARASRPFELEASNMVVALNGSFLCQEGGMRDGFMAPVGVTSSIKMDHVTAFLGKHLIELRSGQDIKGLIPIRCVPVADCLFVSAAGKALIHLEGRPNDFEEKMKSQVAWEGTHNAYSNFDQMLDQQEASGADMPAAPISYEKWRNYTGETDPRFLNKAVKFSDSPNSSGLTRAMPAQFQIKDADLQLCGAETNTLPRPSTEP
jgi:hypothetical protein